MAGRHTDIGRKEMSADTKRQSFVEMAEGRTNRCIKNIRLLRELSNPSKYRYTIGDLERIKATVEGELEAMMHDFKASLISENDFKL